MINTGVEMSVEALGKIRDEINEVDLELVELLNRRLKLALNASAAKLAECNPVLDLARENDVIERVCRANEGPMTDDQLIALYLQLMQQSRQLQESLRANPETVIGKTPATVEWFIPPIDTRAYLTD